MNAVNTRYWLAAGGLGGEYVKLEKSELSRSEGGGGVYTRGMTGIRSRSMSCGLQIAEDEDGDMSGAVRARTGSGKLHVRASSPPQAEEQTHMVYGYVQQEQQHCFFQGRL